jgi:hypothetical protein
LKSTEKIPQKRVNVNLEAPLHDRFKATAASRGRKMTEILIEYIERYVRNNGKPSGGKIK